MAKFSTHAIALLIPVALWSQQQTETIRLRNGTEIIGGIVSADDREITVFKSLGLAVEDIFAAHLVLNRIA